MVIDVDNNGCQCGGPTRWASDPRYPVEFDQETGEYHLIGSDRQAVMYYCFACGGRLPQSKRGEFFSQPDEGERSEVKRILAEVENIDDVRRILGPADDTFERQQQDIGHSVDVVEWKRTLRYSTRWKTFVLDVQETPNGEIRWVIIPRYLGARDRPQADGRG